MKRHIFTLFVLFFGTFFATAQEDPYTFYYAHEAWEGGVQFGVNSFWGDVDDGTNKIFPATPFQSSFYQQRQFVLGGHFGKRLAPFWSVAVSFKLSNLSGRNHKEDLQFISKLNNEVVFITTFDILKMARANPNWSLYPRVGVGVYGFKSRLWNISDGAPVAAFPEGNIFQYSLAIPFGVGVGYRPLPELHLFLETSMTWVNSDLLDAWRSPRRAFEGVWTTSIGVSYQFDFPAARKRGNGRYDALDPALKKDNAEAQYNRRKMRSSTINEPVKSKSKSAVKNKKAKRKTFKR